MQNAQVLENTRLKLAPLELSHAEGLLEFTQEADLWTWWLREPPTSLPLLKKEIERAITERETGTRIPFVIYEKTLDKHIGSTSFFFDSKDKSSVEIGSTWLGKPFHGTGTNGEVKKLMLRYAFDILKVEQVILQTDSLNLRSQKAILNIGAQFLEKREKHKKVWDGRIRDSMLYVIKKP